MQRKMIAVLTCLSLVAALTLALTLKLNAQEKTYAASGLIRLHVVANSDSPADQEMKRAVRDDIINAIAPAFLETGDIDSARDVALANLNRIQDIASNRITAEGKDYPVKVELNSFAFPTKHYGPFVLPAGDYEAVRVLIGAGGGANWWCVLFPPLCFVDMSKTPAAKQNDSPAQAQSIAEKTAAGTGGDPAVSLTNARSASDENASESLKTVSRVEYRFKILDLIKAYWTRC